MPKNVVLEVAKKLVLALFLSFLVPIIATVPVAKAATLSFSPTTSGQAGHSAKYWGQVFTIPAGYSGTITSISNMTLECYGSAVTPTGDVKIYDSRLKTNLLGTSTNTATLNACPSGFGGSTNFTANFAGIPVTAGQQYYFEFTFLTGTGNRYFYENFSANYTGGASYESFDGVTYSSGSEILKFTVNISTGTTPTITSISPNSGATAGGTSITISGSDFASGATVTIGGASATVSSVSSTSITATTPASTSGAQNVVVTNTDGGTATSTGGFTYGTAPTIGSASISGTANKGQTLTAAANTTSDGGLTTTNSYQWQSAATVGGSYSNIAGATSGTYAIANTDIGKYIKVVITRTNSAGSATATSSATALVNDGLFLRYDAGESSSYSGSGTTLNDISGSGIGGSLLGATGYPTINNNYGKFFTFDASKSQYIDVADIPAIDFSNGFSATFFANFGSSANNYERIFDFGNGNAANNILVARNSTTGSLHFETYNGSSTNGVCLAANAIVSNWAHYAVTVDSSGCKIYVNGSEVSKSGTTGIPNSVLRQNNYLGKSNWVADAYFESGIARISIWNRALSSSEVSARQAAETPAPSISLSTSSISVARGSAITTLTTTAYGGTPTSYSISPALPSGLSLNTSTGAVSGTPTVGLSSTTFTITANGLTGSPTATFTLSISATQLGQPTVTSGSTVAGSTTSAIKVSFISVANASSYTARVYASDGVTLIGNPYTNYTSDGSLTGLSPNTAYKVSITAVGDGVSYSNSVAGFYAANITTLAAAVSPTISTHPSNKSKESGSTAAFSVAATASDSGSLSYQWQTSADGSTWSNVGTNANSYTTGTLSGSDDGLRVRVVVTNTKNSTTASTTSNVATISIVSYSNLLTTLNESGVYDGNWIVRSNVRYAHQFQAGAAATIGQFIVSMGNTQRYESQIKIVIYNDSSNTVGSKIGELTYASTSGMLSYYEGSVSIPGSGTYWFELQPTAEIANHYYDGTTSTGVTGSTAGWAQVKTQVANGSNSISWSYFGGTPYTYPVIAIRSIVTSFNLSSVSQSKGSTAGGNSVVINGSGLSGASSVTFDGTAATITANTSSSITVTVPAHAAGTVDIAVVATGGSGTLAGAYSYVSPPTLSGAAISGTTTQGQTLTAAVQGAGGGIVTSTTYQWTRADTSSGTYSNISGATSSTYLLTSGDVGKYIKVTISVSNGAGTNSATSTATNVIAISAPTIGSASISGTLNIGDTLTATPGSIGGGTAASTAYQWQSSNTASGTYTNISGATSNTYVLSSAEVGKYLKVTITLSNAAGSASRTSNATASGVTSNIPTPTISGISPNAGTTAGGTSVTISGTNLSTVTGVTFDGLSATISSKTSTQVVVSTPAHAAGAVNVVVTNTAGSTTSTNGFTYATAPTTRSWTTTPSITTGNVNDTFTVTYTAVCTTPQRYGPSMYDLIYYNNGSWAYNSYMGSGTSNDGGYTWTITKTYTLTATGTWKIDAYERGACWDSYNFTYAPRNYINVGVSGPTITSLSTTSGPIAGGTATTITGTNLTGVTGITVGGAAATSIRSNTATSVTFNTPAGTAGAKNVVVTTQAGNATSTGGFTYVAPITVTYDVNGADSGTPSRTTDSYSPNTGGFSLPTVGSMTKAGHTFAGWATANNSNTALTSPYNPQNSLTVYAIWTAKNYTTTYNANGATSGSAPTASSNAYGSTVTVAANSGSLARTGFTLAGWDTAADGSGTSYILNTGTFTQGAANQILYAEWVPVTYSVAYDVNGSSDSVPTTQSGIVANGAITLAAGVTKAGSAFVGWEENSITYKAGATYRIGNSNVTMVAKWIPVYTLVYNLNGSGASGSLPADFQYASGDTVTVTSTIPTRTGYTFGGWLDQSGGSHAASSTYAISAGNYLLYAVWNPISYTVTYDLNSGTSTLPTESAKTYQASFTLAAAPTRAGYTFTGWSDSSTVYGAAVNYIMPAANTTLTAQWSVNSYVITYDLAQGTSSVPDPVTKAFASTWQLPAAPTRVGYNFADWYDGTNGYAAESNFTLATAGNLTITARWNAIVYYTVTYDLAGGLGTAPTQDPLQNGQSFTLPSDPSKTGHSFTGWSYAGNSYTSGQTLTMPASNVTVTATWTETTAGTYAITYISNGAQTAAPTMPSLAQSATFTVDDGSGLIKNGYIFSGWSYSGTTYIGGETFTMPASAVTFSAIWVPSVRATSVSQTVDSTSITRGRSITVTYSLGCYNSSSAPTITEKVTSTGESFINDITSALTIVDAGYNWTVTRVYTLSFAGTYTIMATAENSCFASATDSTALTVAVTEPTASNNSGNSDNSSSSRNNSSSNSGSSVTSIPPVTVVGARIALVANKYYTLPKIAINTTVSVEAKAGATATATTKTESGSTVTTATTLLRVNETPKGLSEIKIVENQLAVIPAEGFSGKTTVSVTVTDGQTTSKIEVPVTVLPEPVKDPAVTPVSARSTVVTWAESPNANSYQVFVDGKSACRTSGESCTINKVLGPNADVSVVANGGDATKSEVVDADYQAKNPVTIAKISGTFGKSTLSQNDITNLNKVIATVTKQGFESVQITGTTTTKRTAAAAKARLDAMIEYIKSKVDNPDLVVKVVAPTSTTYTNQVAVK